MLNKDWNAAYESGATPWDKGAAAPPIREFLESQQLQGRALLPGCGLGHDVRLLAEHGVDAVGMDLAPAAIAAAREHRLGQLDNYELGDFLQLARRHHGQYDWLVEHTCLCALDPAQRHSYVDSVYQALKPGGNFLAVFFRVVSDYQADGPPHPISEDEISNLFDSRFERVEAFVPQQSYACRPVGSEQVVWMIKRDC